MKMYLVSISKEAKRIAPVLLSEIEIKARNERDAESRAAMAYEARFPDADHSGLIYKARALD